VNFYLALGGVYPFSSGMSDLDGYVGEIVAMASNYAPYGFAPCDGRLLLRSDYPSLFSLIGTTFGGDGVTYFAVPDLRSRVPVMSTAALPAGTAFGEQATYLTEANLPAHRHTVLLSACSLADVAGGGPTGLSPDGVVDGSDFIAFINSFGTGDIGTDALADVAGGGPDGLQPDGVIDGGDFVAFINAFAAGC
jgi:microcystin-dependent protein